MYNLILIIIIPSALSSTYLTLENCASNFEVSSANDTSKALKEVSPQTMKLFYSSLNSQSSQTRIQNMINNGDTQDFQKQLVQLILPYIPILIASFIMYTILICCCVFDKTCPPCQSWRRDFNRRPYQKKQLTCAMAFGIFFAVGILITCIYSFTVIPSLKQDKDNTKCSIFMAVDTALNGDLTNGWGGFNTLKTQIGNISSLLSSAGTQVTTYFTSNEWLINNMNDLKSYNLNIYKNNKDSKLITPDPTSTEATIAGQPLPTINSVFIQTGLGPNGTFGTMVDDIDRGLRTTQKLSTQAYAIDQSAKQMSQSAATIQQNTNNSQQTMNIYVSQLNTIVNNLNAFSKSAFDQYFGYGLYAVQAAIGLILAGSLLLVVGMISTSVFDIFQCRSMVHIGWVIYGITHMLVILLVYLFLSVGSLGYGSCTYFNSLLSNQSSYQAISNQPSKNYLSKLDSCLYGDGDILTQFGVSAEMDTVTKLFTNINTYYDYTNPSSNNYIDPSISLSKIAGWSAAMTNYGAGIYIDSNPTETATTNPNYAINQLNKYSYTGGVYPTCSKDRWVFDAVNCTTASQTTYITGNQTYGLTISTSNVMCMSLNSKISTSMASPWSQNDFLRRYIQIKQSCNSSYDMIMSLGKSLINYRDSRISLFQGIKDSLGTLSGLNTNFNTNLTSFRTNVDGFYSSVSSLNNLVTNQINGLLVTKNCTVLRKNLLFNYNTFCVNLMSRATAMGISMITLSILMIGGILTANIFATRYARIERQVKIHAKIDSRSEISDEFTKKKPQSNSSSSSEED